MENLLQKKFITTSELAKLMGISRIAVFKKIQKGVINAQKNGRRYIINGKDLPTILRQELTDAQKKDIAQAVSRVVNEYGETLRMLGNE